jgi:hypothetical protein
VIGNNNNNNNPTRLFFSLCKTFVFGVVDWYSCVWYGVFLYQEQYEDNPAKGQTEWDCGRRSFILLGAQRALKITARRGFGNVVGVHLITTHQTIHVYDTYVYVQLRIIFYYGSQSFRKS